MLRVMLVGAMRLGSEECERAHKPYKAGCCACVAGRSRTDPLHPRDEGDVPIDLRGGL